MSGPAESRLGAALGEGLHAPGRYRPLVGAFERIVTRISCSDDVVRAAGEGLPQGAALAEAVAVRLRRGEALLEWGPPEREPTKGDVLRLSERRGRSSVEIVRADPSLLPELQIGAWFDADWRVRLLRRATRVPPSLFRLLPATPSALTLAADLAFWHGVRSAATANEWRRWTRNSYVALVYHRFAGELKPGQELIDLAPRSFARQLRLLRRLGFTHLRAAEMLAFHEAPDAEPPRRSFVATVDDGFLDCLEPLRQHARFGPQLFVPTGELGGRASWLDGEPLLDWERVRELAAAGVAVGSHARHHRRLRGLKSSDLADELAGSIADLHEYLAAPLDVVAYPHGDHDADVRQTAIASGFRAAFTTEKGRNGLGTDRYCLRRVSVHGHDSALAVLWKVVTGETLPVPWLRFRRRG